LHLWPLPLPPSTKTEMGHRGGPPRFEIF
jgi:hypothetical protein